MSNKKLFSEIERTLKKCAEGILNYDDIHLRIENAPSHQRERLEADLKKELKKLQKYRETIKQWINNDIIKDKSHLKSMRKQIEERMESFKKCEKETKTKAYSKEALRKSKTQKPHKPSIQLTDDQIEAKQWFEMQINELITENEEKELEIEKYQNTSRSNKKYRNKMNTKQQNEINKINERIDRNKWHLLQLQICLDKIINNEIDPLLYKNIADDVEYYVKEAMDDDTYIHYDEMYHVITHFQSQSQSEDDDDDVDDDDDDVDVVDFDNNDDEEKDKNKNKNDDNDKGNDNDADDDDDDDDVNDIDNAQINGNENQHTENVERDDVDNDDDDDVDDDDDDDDDMMHLMKRKTNKNSESIKNKKEQLQKKLKEKNKRSKQHPYDSISAQLLQDPLKTQAQQTQKQRPNKPPITNNTESDLAPFCRRLSDSEREILDIINEGFVKRPQPLDTHEPSFYKPSAPFLTPPYFPKERRKMFDNSHVFSLMELDTLFFIFYYQSQSYQQFMAAKELKIRGWSFNKRYSAWFQRHFSGNNNNNTNIQQQVVDSVNVDSETSLFKDEDKLSPMKQNLAKNEMKSLNGKGQHIIVDNKYERGTYIFFDRNQSWQMRMRENFKFDYQYLEDEQCVNVDDKIDWKRLATYGNGFGLIYGEQKKLMRYHQLQQQRRSNAKQQQQSSSSRSTGAARHHHPTRPPTQRFRPPIHHRQSRR